MNFKIKNTNNRYHKYNSKKKNKQKGGEVSLMDTTKQGQNQKEEITNKLNGIYRENNDLIGNIINYGDNIINNILLKIPLPFNIEKMIIFLKMIINNSIAYMIQVKDLLKETINDNPNEMAINFIINLTGLFCNQRHVYQKLHYEVKQYFLSKTKGNNIMSEGSDITIEFDKFNNNIYSSILEVFENFYRVYDKLCSIRIKLLGINELLQESKKEDT